MIARRLAIAFFAVAAVAAVRAPQAARATPSTCSLVSNAEIATIVKHPVRRAFSMSDGGCNIMLKGAGVPAVIIQRHLSITPPMYDQYVTQTKSFTHSMSPVTGIGERAAWDGDRLLVYAKSTLWIFSTSSMQQPKAQSKAQLKELAAKALARA